MKTFGAKILVWLAAGVMLSTLSVRGELEVSGSVRISARSDFDAPLAGIGTWVEVGSYGRCWRPARVEVGWRPYCDGYWVWTDCGWYWETSEPWGWACYHYGAWVCDPEGDWFWVPGVEWAPAWVCWREGGGYIGWAPLAPGGVAIAGPEFVFVETANFQRRVRPAGVLKYDAARFSRTALLGNPRRESRAIGDASAHEVYVNPGPSAHAIEQATGHRVQTASIMKEVGRTRVPSGLLPQAKHGVSNDNAPPLTAEPSRPAPRATPAPGPSATPSRPFFRDYAPKDEVPPPARASPGERVHSPSGPSGPLRGGSPPSRPAPGKSEPDAHGKGER
jgi:hypothetical protein